MLQMRTSILTTIVVMSIALTSCAPPEPVRIGFLGGLSGRVSDLGISGLNGVRLAVELRNKAGGIKGRQIELIEADDQQDPEAARQAIGYLMGHKVAAVVGPMTSAVAIAAVPLANQAQLVMISPTVTSNDFSGIDDYFFRVIPPTREFVKTSADHHFHTLGLRNVRLIHDLRNRSYTESWLKDFTQEFSAAGGKLLPALGYTSGDEVNFIDLARQVLSGNPDGIIILANSVDAAMLCQSIRKLNPSIVIGTSEWAATERLIELGGKSVEGIAIAQFHDRQGKQPAFMALRTAYVMRYRQEPGFAGLFAYDAANVLFEALEKKAPDQSLKQTLLAEKKFAGTQRSIVFDASGDTIGKTFIVTVTEGVFVPLQAAP